MDAIANFAYGIVATAPSPETSGTSLILQSGQGAQFPAAPFDVLMWPSGEQPLIGNAELARCTAKTSDTLTITRAQYGTTAQSVAVGYQVCQPIDVSLIQQLAALNPPSTPQVMTGTLVEPRVLTVPAPGGTPTLANIYESDVVYITGLANAITNMSTGITGLSSMQPFQMLRFAIIDNGTAQTIGWGSAFEAATTLPSSTPGGGTELDVTFWYNPASGLLRCVGTSPSPAPIVMDIGSSSFAVPTSVGTVFTSPPTLQPGNYKVTFSTEVVAASGVAAGGTASFGLVPSASGGAATYTATVGATNNQPGCDATMPTATNTDDGIPTTFTTRITVTAAGTMNINAIASGADMKCKAQGASSVGYTTQVTVMTIESV